MSKSEIIEYAQLWESLANIARRAKDFELAAGCENRAATYWKLCK